MKNAPPQSATETAPVDLVASQSSALSIFDNGSRFDHFQRVAKALSSSDLVPQQFKGNVPNTLIALDMADRLRANPLAIMQSLYVVHGKPSWSAQFVISMINSCGKFSPLRFEVSGTGDAKSCVAWAKELSTGERLDGPPVTIGMAKSEGWHGKNGSKWQTMPELMLRYRAATFFGRLYCPEMLMGMQTADELTDIETVAQPSRPVFQEASLLSPAPVRQSDEQAEADAGLAPARQPTVPPPTAPPTVPEPPSQTSEHAELTAFLGANGLGYQQLQEWAKKSEFYPNADTYGTIDELPIAVVRKLLNSKTGLLGQLKARK